MKVCGTVSVGNVSASALTTNETLTCNKILVQSDPANQANVLFGNSNIQAIVLTVGTILVLDYRGYVKDLCAISATGTCKVNWAVLE